MKEHMMKSAIRVILLTSFVIFCLVSCPSYRGYGVLVWKNENLPFPVGELLKISSVFSVDNYYEVDYNGTFVQVPMWQVQFFETNDEAVNFQKAFKPYIETYVSTLKYNGLPIRKEPLSTATMVFRLKPGKIAKVLSRDEKKTKIGGLEDYWYRILTEEGEQGYIFGYYLKVDSGATIRDTMTALMNEDPALDRFLNNVWRPLEMQEMIESGKIDMEFIRRNYGLIPKPNEKKIILITSDVSKEYTYSAIKKISGDTYEIEGTDLKIQIFPSNKINASYFYENEYVTTEYVLLEEDLDEIMRFETDRWQNLFYQFLNRGKTMTSAAYGTIEIMDKFRFRWSGFEALDSIIPSGVAGDGSVSFTRYLGPLVSGSYDGAITFIFDEEPKNGVTFVYQFVESGVKMFYISRDNMEDNEVRRIGSSPLVLGFNFQ